SRCDSRAGGGTAKPAHSKRTYSRDAVSKGHCVLFSCTGLDKGNVACYIQNIVIKHCYEYRLKEGDRMAKQKPGVYDRVLECAKEEFLSKGFLDASLRTIAQEAGTSTGSIYTRFGDKEGLFQA